MKNNTLFKLFLIMIVALLFRLWFIDKPEGLWNDEYMGWYIASKNNFSDFIAIMLQNCHMPFYFLYLKGWMFLFGDTDISLRFSSVIPSLCTIIAVFFAGRELKDTKLGLFTAFLTAINSFCIYFAQEVRLYSLIMLFTTLIVMYFIKITRLPSKRNFIIYFLLNALLCMTHTLGVIFSFFNIAAAIVYLYREKGFFKEKVKAAVEFLKYTAPFIVVVLLLLPLLFIIVSSKSLSQFWAEFSFSRVFFSFLDYFSPIQTNIINSPGTICAHIFNNEKFNFIFIIFAIVPALMGIFALYNAVLQKNKTINYLLSASLLYFISLIAISLTGKMILLTKYSSEIYPVIILAAAYGLISIKKKTFKYILIGLLITVNLFYLLTSNDAAPKRTRSEGHLAVVQLLKNSRLKSKDFVILTYYDIDKFERYLDSSAQYNFSSINKFNFNYVIFNNENYYETIHLGKRLYKDNLAEFPNKTVTKYILSNYICKMNKGDKIGIVFLDTVSFLSNQKIQDIIQEDDRYNRTPFIFLAFSALRNSILYSFKTGYKIDSITQAGDWTLFVFEKTE